MFNALVYRNKVHAVALQVHASIRIFLKISPEFSHGQFGIAAPFEGESRKSPNLEIPPDLAWRNFGKTKKVSSTVAEACAGEPIEAIVSNTNTFVLFSLKILAIFCSFFSGNIRLEEFSRVPSVMILAYTCTNPFYATRTTQKMSLWSRRTMETRYVALTMFILEFDLFLPCFCPKCS